MKVNKPACTIRIETKYGRKLFYPVDANAMALAKLIGKDTLTKEALETIESDLGYEVQVKADTEWRA